MTDKTNNPGNPPITSRLDLKGVACPINYVKTKMALEELEEGQVLEVILDNGESMMNIPRSLKNDGHKILSVEKMGEEGSFRLLIEKRE